jgi:chromosome segregation ATPase
VSAIADSSQRLIDATAELDSISKQLIEIEKVIERQEPQIEDTLEGYIAALYEECQESGERLPPEDVRKALAHKALNAELKRAYRANLAVRRRCKSRLADLREIVAAHRSIVSAAKSEIEAASGPQPAWSGSAEFPNG